MSALRFILANLAHFRRIHVAVALGVAVATAVLTGALLVGDSVRGSLRALTLERLGKIDAALVAKHTFREALANEMVADENFREFFTSAEPAILMTGTLQAGNDSTFRRATRVNIVGCRETFWALGEGGPPVPLADGEVAITQRLADELGIAAGSEIQLRVPTSGAIPADSPLGKKDETSSLAHYRVAVVLLPRGLSRFGLTPTQYAPRSIFVPLDAVQELLDKPGQANTILVAGLDSDSAVSAGASEILQSALRPRLEDYGLKVTELTSPAPLIQISADQLVVADEVVRAAERASLKSGLQPIVTYLANTLVAGTGETERKIPYSTITGVDSTAKLGPLLDDAGQPIVLADNEIVLNDRAAKDLEATVGDEISVTFYEPESTHGELRERQPPPKFRLRAIVDLENSVGEPTRAADPLLTPELPGVTDQDSIADWDLPFELVEKIRPQDEEYWDKYRTTPKAFVSLASAKRLWKSRWGTISLLRIADSTESDISESLMKRWSLPISA
jgi:ABC-type lipoprotein release transport system permease subunit